MVADLARLKKLYPFESHYLSVDGHRMHYVDEGAGPAVLMLHGNPTWSFYYRELIKGLSSRYRIIAPDHIGCGLSDKPQQYEYTLKTHVNNIERLIDDLQLSDVTLVVHDWGGAIGFGLCSRRPELASRFIVFNSTAFAGPCPLRIRICAWPVVGSFAVRRLNAFAGGAVHLACKKPERMTSDVKHGYLMPYASFSDRVGVFGFVRDIPLTKSAPSYAVLKDIEASLLQYKNRPMLLLWGDKDFCFNDWYLREWIARFPDAVVHRFADAGHYVVEDAHELILPLIKDFLAGNDESRPCVEPTP